MKTTFSNFSGVVMPENPIRHRSYQLRENLASESHSCPVESKNFSFFSMRLNVKQVAQQDTFNTLIYFQ